jgi:hypothetical protein
MHPMTTHSLAIDTQRRMLDQAAADRLARAATAGRPSLRSRLLDVIRRGGAHPAGRPECPTATTSQA